MDAAAKSLTSSVCFTGARERLRDWWTQSSEERLRETEEALLRNAVSSKMKVMEVPISDGQTVHTLCVSQGAQGARAGSGLAPVVLIHGYFMGSGSWAHSFDSLASTGRNVYSIDWPGWGLSSKPDFPMQQAGFFKIWISSLMV